MNFILYKEGARRFARDLKTSLVFGNIDFVRMCFIRFRCCSLRNGFAWSNVFYLNRVGGNFPYGFSSFQFGMSRTI